jgi:hypothetical protein
MQRLTFCAQSYSTHLQNAKGAPTHLAPQQVAASLPTSLAEGNRQEPGLNLIRSDLPVAVGATSAMFVPGSLHCPQPNHDVSGAPIQSLSREPSFSDSDNGSDYSTSDSPIEKPTMETLMTDIDSFVRALDEVTLLRVTSQQKRRALIRARDKVARKDEAVASVLRKLRAEKTMFDGYGVPALSDDSLQARDELGPLEDDFDSIEYRLVPKEDGLKERGEEIKRQWETLKVELDRSSSFRVAPGDSRNPDHSTAEKSNILAPDGGSESQPLTEESLLHRNCYIRTPRARGTTRSEPLVQQYAPDLSFDSPWTAIGKPWQHINYVNDDPSPKLVKDEDLSDVGKAKTDNSDKGNDLLLGNSTTIRCSFLRELALENFAHYGRRVSFWLLCRLRKSRLEVLRLRLTLDLKTKEWEWADILRFWNLDDAALARTPPDSEDIYYTNARPETLTKQILEWHSTTEPQQSELPSFNHPMGTNYRHKQHKSASCATKGSDFPLKRAKFSSST